jgi:hypothetical protein
VVATVLLLQALEGLSDREAVSAMRRDIAWKVTCGLRLNDEGFSSHGAGVLAQPHPHLAETAADLGGGPPSGGGDWGATAHGSTTAPAAISLEA